MLPVQIWKSVSKRVGIVSNYVLWSLGTDILWMRWADHQPHYGADDRGRQGPTSQTSRPNNTKALTRSHTFSKCLYHLLPKALTKKSACNICSKVSLLFLSFVELDCVVCSFALLNFPLATQPNWFQICNASMFPSRFPSPWVWLWNIVAMEISMGEPGSKGCSLDFLEIWDSSNVGLMCAAWD